MKTPLLIAAFSLFLAASAPAQNLLANGDFSDTTNPLKGWRTDFPYEGPYVDNVKYVSVVNQFMGEAHAVLLDLPKGVADNQGGKVESDFVKIEPGAKYRAMIKCMTNDLTAKLFAEAWALDPLPIDVPSKFRIPPRNGMPGLVMCYRADFSDPPPLSKKWTMMSREFKVPAKVLVAGKPEEPQYLSLKVVVVGGVGAVGKSYFGDFSIEKIQ